MILLEKENGAKEAAMGERSMKILIVDDNASDRKLLRLIFEKYGYHSIIEAGDGLEGIDMARAMAPDIIVSDALMPRMDGFQFLWTIKMDEDLRNIPFLFHSAVYTGLKEEELALHLGAEGFITRPKEPDEFWREMAPVLEDIASGRRKPKHPQLLAEEMEYLRKYSEVVARKLEEKVRELEETLARRKKAEDELLKLSLAVEQSPVSIIITDLDGNIEFINPKFCEITGYSTEEVIGRNPRILKSGETPSEEYERLWAAITTGKVWHGEFHNKRKNGKLFWESATISPVKNREGTISHYMAIKEDITETKRLEEQLLHSQKMEAVGSLAGGIAHDFNNILTAIMGYSSILKIRMPKGDPLLTNVIQIQAAAERAAGLTRSLLAFSRKQQIDTKVVDLNAVVNGIRNMLSRLIREDIELRIVPAEEGLPVLADVGQLEQVLLNLTTNACDAMAIGGSITITTGVAELEEELRDAEGIVEPGRYALLTFADTGAGMEEGVRQRMFDPFFTTKEVGKGTGLGLAICYGIIMQHGGYIECRSEPEKGAAFRIYLPLVETIANHIEPSETLPLTWGSETILVAEDDPGTMGVTTEILTEFGYTVIPAGDGEEAVAVYRDHWREIGLCLLDVVMPKKRGCQVFEDLRRINPVVKVLFMSGYQEDVSLRNHIISKGNCFIAKPMRAHELLQKVREALER
jgi:two-component system cell cycle sensor histidine kinase/response regulator CckA